MRICSVLVFIPHEQEQGKNSEISTILFFRYYVFSGILESCAWKINLVPRVYSAFKMAASVSRHLESGVDPGNEVVGKFGGNAFYQDGRLSSSFHFANNSN